MNTVTIITYVLATVAAVAATSILFVKEVFHAAILLIVCLLCVAGIFVTFNAEFVGIVQLIVYAGGVLILIIFGIMLTARSNFIEEKQNKFVAVFIGIGLFSIFVYALSKLSLPENVGNPVIETLSPESIGTLLMSRYSLPFEVAGMLLLISLIGAIVAATNVKKTGS